MKKSLSARFLFAGFIVLLVVLLVLVVVNNLRPVEVAVVSQILRSEDDFAMKRLDYTETRNGVRKWTVQAESARHDLKGEVAHLNQLTLTFYDPASNDLVVTSSTGELDLKKSQILLQGDVVMKAKTGETVYTDELLFVDSEKSVRTEHPVRFVADGYTVSGTGMQFHITSRSLSLQSQVEAVYKEGLNVK